VVAGEVVGAERQGLQPAEVILQVAQVQGERILQQAEAGQGFLEAADCGGDGLEDLVEVVGGGAVGSAFDDRRLLLSVVPPVEQIGSEHPTVAVVAVEVPRAGIAFDDRLEGAESAFGGGALAAEVNDQGFCLLPVHPGHPVRQQFAGARSARPGDPNVPEDVLDLGPGDLGVVLGHRDGQVAEVAADVTHKILPRFLTWRTSPGQEINRRATQ
jgi:hypothetical protein